MKFSYVEFLHIMKGIEKRVWFYNSVYYIKGGADVLDFFYLGNSVRIHVVLLIFRLLSYTN